MGRSLSEQEAGEKLAGLLLELKALGTPEHGTPEYTRYYDLQAEIKTLERGLGCNCATRSALIKDMRRRIGYGQFGLAAVAAKTFVETIGTDLKNIVSK